MKKGYEILQAANNTVEFSEIKTGIINIICAELFKWVKEIFSKFKSYILGFVLFMIVIIFSCCYPCFKSFFDCFKCFFNCFKCLNCCKSFHWFKYIPTENTTDCIYAPTQNEEKQTVSSQELI